MIEEKLKMAAEKLPMPQTTFKNILERAAQESVGKGLWAKLVSRVRATKDY